MNHLVMLRSEVSIPTDEALPFTYESIDDDDSDFPTYEGCVVTDSSFGFDNGTEFDAISICLDKWEAYVWDHNSEDGEAIYTIPLRLVARETE